MKVAYNACYGGFRLSPAALTRFAEKKGITLTWYEKSFSGATYTKIEGLPRNALFGPQAFTKDYGDSFEKYDEGTFYYPYINENETRSDPDLISVIEELGEKANGSCASLSIKEIPNGAEFEITEYDGSENVVPPRQSW